VTGPLLAASGLTLGYEGVPVVHDLDLTVSAGEVVALVGANGAGKTTTLLGLSGLLPPLGGRAEVLGQVLPHGRRARPGAVWRLARAGMAHVPEDRALFYDLTVAENLRLGRRPRSDGPDDATVLGWFPALDSVMDRRAGLLSGGEQQMLALARALVAGPRLLLVDELSLGLAPIIVEQILPVLRTVATETGVGVLVVEQHVAMVLATSDRAYLLQRGRVAHAGPAADLAGRADLIEAGYLGARPDP
jgi:branched-chain amino acid transport system ATP-binding protein